MDGLVYWGFIISVVLVVVCVVGTVFAVFGLVDAVFYKKKVSPVVHTFEKSNVENSTKERRGSLNLILGSMYSGKCCKRGTEILMYDGTIKKVEDVKSGDLLMGDDSSPRTVLNTATGRGEMFEVTPLYGNPYTVNDAHVLSLKCYYDPRQRIFDGRQKRFQVKFLEGTKLVTKFFSVDDHGTTDGAKEASEIFLARNPGTKVGDILDIPLREYLELPERVQNYYHGYATGVEFQKQATLEIDPYLLGLWLGDGAPRDASITTTDPEIVEYLKRQCVRMGLSLTQFEEDPTRYFMRGGPGFENYFVNFLRDNSLVGNKHIPHRFKCASRENRLKLLAGIIDSDGHNSPAHDPYEIAFESEQLAEDLTFLARSLGFRVEKLRTKVPGDPSKKVHFRFLISGSGLHNVPTLLERKKVESPMTRSDLLTPIIIESVGDDDYYGFSLDGNGRYLHSDFMVTHNTRELKRRVDVARIACATTGHKLIVIRHRKDNRYDEKALATHSGEIDRDVELAETMAEVSDKVASCRFVFIDEGQFYPDLKDQCLQWARGGKEVHIAALDAYSNQTLWPQISAIFAWASHIVKLNAICPKCGEEAPLTVTVTGSKEAKTEIGGKELYDASCIYCCS